MRNLCAAALVLLFAASLPAQDKPKPDTPQQAADKVLAAFEAKKEKALKTLAAKDNPDPWLVADELCFRGEHDAAEAFAEAAPRPDTEKLPAYVARVRGREPDGAARTALAAARRALADKNPNEALTAMDAAPKDLRQPATVLLLCQRGLVLRSLRRLEESAEAFSAAADAAERLGWHARTASALRDVGYSCWLRSDFRGALEASARALRVEEERMNRVGMARALGNIANVHSRLGDYRRALENQERSLALYEELGNRAGAAKTLGNIGLDYHRLGDYARALEYYEKSLALKEELGNRVGAAVTLGNIGALHLRLGDYTRALKCQERSLALREELNDRAGIAASLSNVGLIYQRLGDYPRALEHYEKALKLADELRYRVAVATILRNLGDIHASLGDHPRALDYQERSLDLRKELGDRPGVAGALESVGNTYFRLGEYPRALDCHEKSLKLREELGDRPGKAASLNGIGLIYHSLGDYPRALEHYEKALKLSEELRDPARMAAILGNIGSIHWRLGEYPRALECQEKSLKLREELGDRPGTATTLGNIGLIYHSLGDYARALEYQTKTLEVEQKLGRQMGVAATLGNMGVTYERLGDYPRALEHYERALELTDRLGDRARVATLLGNIGVVHYRLGSFARALRSARRAVEMFPLLLGGLSGDLSATAAEKYSWLVSTGVRAGMRLKEPGEVSYFIESVRAGELRECLGGRDALRGAALPASLLDVEQRARAAVVTTRKMLARSLSKGNRRDIAEAQAARAAAEATFLEVVGRIQREAKAVADLAYPRAAPLSDIQGSLHENDVLVSYALLPEQAVALVVDRDAARAVELGTPEELGSVAAALSWAKATEPWEERAAKARRALLDPLGLPEKTKRILIAPDGVLAYVPFALLAGEREAVLVPSGTTHGVLLEERQKRGEKILALGDPDYGVKPDPRAATVMRAGARLMPLPGTRKEVQALGDVVLLRDRATESGLASVLGKEQRWRAVHLACHGLVRPDQPQLSSLALTPDAGNDGFLTVLEVLRMRIPADLVVLSACESAKGKVYRAEGVIGFTRAFMMAGAPRVIVSLWKVDDEATRVLMVKFYELWNPKDGSKGLPTATALKKAQEYVASQEKWKHPYYWAAWQLWGLAD